jgi:aldehyde dehydrogenase (NAD+)
MSAVREKIVPAPAAPAATFAEVFAKQKAFAPSLRTSSAEERLAKLERIRDMIGRYRDRIYAALAADFRKPEAEVDLAEIFPIVHEINQARRHLKRWMKPKRVLPTLAMLGTSAEIRYEPKGVCLIISPWNYPVNLTFGPLVSALAAGNTAILKPSEITPRTSALMAEMVRETFPPEEVALFEGDASVATALLELPFDHIFFTGSTAHGRSVMAAAAKHLASVTLELGGKSPAVVDETADIAKAAKNLVWGKFTNNGQTCIAPDYVLVQETVKDRFLTEVSQAIAKSFGGNAERQAGSADYCRIVNQKHFERIKSLIDDAENKGAKVVIGGETRSEERFIAPTVLTDVAKDADILREEVFGPVMPVVGYSDLDAAIDEINGRPKPLSLYVFSRDSQHAEKVLRNTSAGGSCVNHSLVQFLHGHLPFGGVNNSGIGNAHGYFGFKAFSHERAVVKDRFSITHMLFPPYTGLVRRLVKLTVRLFA